MRRFLRGLGFTALGLGAAAGIEGARRASSEVDHVASAIATPSVELSPRSEDDPLVVVKDPETGETAPLVPKGERLSIDLTVGQDQELEDYFKNNKGLAKKYEYGRSHGRDHGVIRLKDKRLPETVARVRGSITGSGGFVITDRFWRQSQVIRALSDITPGLLEKLDAEARSGLNPESPHWRSATVSPPEDLPLDDKPPMPLSSLPRIEDKIPVPTQETEEENPVAAEAEPEPEPVQPHPKKRNTGKIDKE